MREPHTPRECIPRRHSEHRRLLQTVSFTLRSKWIFPGRYCTRSEFILMDHPRGLAPPVCACVQPEFPRESFSGRRGAVASRGTDVFARISCPSLSLASVTGGAVLFGPKDLSGRLMHGLFMRHQYVRAMPRSEPYRPCREPRPLGWTRLDPEPLDLFGPPRVDPLDLSDGPLGHARGAEQPPKVCVPQ